MTNDDINEAVARRLGWKRCECAQEFRKEHTAYMPSMHIVPKYSTSIEAAWKIWEKLRDEGYDLQLYSSWDRRNIVCFQATRKMNTSDQLHGEADTAPMAICRAFLKLKDAP